MTALSARTSRSASRGDLPLARGHRRHQGPEIGAGGRGAPRHHRGGGDEALDLHRAAIREDDAALAEQPDRVGEVRPHRREIRRERRRAEHVEVGHRRAPRVRGLRQRPAALEQLLEPGIGDRIEEGAQEEPIGEGRERLVLGQRVRGAHAHAQRDADPRGSAAKRALVEQAEQGVEDRGGAEEDLVEEGDLRLGEHP
jgi:hypothetical protein